MFTKPNAIEIRQKDLLGLFFSRCTNSTFLKNALLGSQNCVALSISSCSPKNLFTLAQQTEIH